MELFRSGRRVAVAPIQPGQRPLHWLDESATPEARRARGVVQDFFDRFPRAGQEALAHKLRQPNPAHLAAVAELYVHELLRVCGYELTVEPQCPSGSRPDFLACLDGRRFYVEVTVDRGMAITTRAEAVERSFLFETRSRVTVPGFAFVVRKKVIGDTNPSPRKFAAFLDRWFGSFSHEEQRQKVINAEKSNEMPRVIYKEEGSGWLFDIQLYPTDEPDTVPDQLAAINFDAGWSDSKGRLQQNMREKLAQHRSCEHPLIIAVVANDFLADQQNVAAALRGTSGSVPVPPSGRRDEGVWSSSNPNASRRSTGLVLAREVFPWTLSSAEPELWDNPLASCEGHLPSWRFRRYQWGSGDRGALVVVPGEQRSLATDHP